MRIRIIESMVGPSATDGNDVPQAQHASSYVVNDTLAIDAGSLGFWGTPEDQARIRHLLITHCHSDHIATLPIFVENVFEAKADCVTVWGNSVTLKCIREDIFNDRLWPDFLAISTPEAPFLKLGHLKTEVPVTLEGIRITPVLLNHTVRTFGLVLESDDQTVVVGSDSAPTKRLWEIANGLDNLKAVFLEAAFPNHMRELAEISMHLTPEMFGEEVQKLERPVPIIAVHIKPRYHTQIVEELMALDLPNLAIGCPGREYTW